MKKPKIVLALLSLFVVVCIAFTFGAPLGIPTWDTLFPKINTATVETNGQLSVHFLDVGKADCIFITDGEKNIVIDSGYNSSWEYINSYLSSYNVKTINLLVASHQDKDHIGSMANIINTYNVNSFWQPALEEDQIPSTSAYTQMEKALSENGINGINPDVGTEVAYNDIKLKVISPAKHYNDINNCSIVIKLTYGNEIFMLMGDAEKQAENSIVKGGADIKADVIKIGHHGSATSTTEKFLSAVNPQIAVISVGPDDNNLPKESVLNRLLDFGVTTYRTDTNGTVVILTDGNTLTVKQERIG